MNKPYIICLQFGTWRNELWFTAADDESTARSWKKAVDKLPELSSECANSGEFMTRSVEHFEQYGFTRIQR